MLVACGESSSRPLRRDVASLREFLRALGGYTLSDAGAAVLLTAADRPEILACGFAAWPRTSPDAPVTAGARIQRGGGGASAARRGRAARLLTGRAAGAAHW